MHLILLRGYKLTFLCAIYWLISTNVVYAEVVELKLKNSLVATAEYKQGEEGKQAVLLLHGFMQTRGAPTINSLFNALSDAGYTVLAPTLSLGIDRRKQRLECEAIHLHSMQSDVAEIDAWSKWLYDRHGSKVVLIGHSTGGVQQVVYLGDNKTDHVKQAILISLGYFGNSPATNETEADAKRARSKIESGQDGIDTFGMSYCKEYATTPERYMSYYIWQPERLIKTMKTIPVKLTAIMGTVDQRISSTWASDIQRGGVDVTLIEGANHFFDAQFEFDLHENIEFILENNTDSE